MAVAQHKVSKSRKRLRRSHNALVANTTTKCKECGSVIKPHRVCPNCGSYKGNKVLEKENAEK